MKITMIACQNLLGYIGKNNKLMWNLPIDLKRFALLTTGKTLIVGRKTFESLPKNMILSKNRNFIVLSKKEGYYPWPHKTPLISVVNNVENLIKYLAKVPQIKQDKEIVVIGGSEIYKEFLDRDLISTIELTTYYNEDIGDCRMPFIDYTKWELTNQVINHDFTGKLYCFFVTLVKK